MSKFMVFVHSYLSVVPNPIPAPLPADLGAWGGPELHGRYRGAGTIEPSTGRGCVRRATARAHEPPHLDCRVRQGTS